jgi:hypothetical protein
MGETMRRGHLVYTLLGLVLLVVGGIWGGPATEAAATLDGRLGGRLASFEETYGQPISGTPEQGADFKVVGFGTVFVQFKLASDPARPNKITYKTTSDSPAIVIALSAPRDVSASATVPDPRDWSISEAETAVRRFLPTDVELGEMAIDGASGSATCTSAAFIDVFPGSSNTCRIGYVLPTETTVSYATLVLAPAEAGDDGPGNPCTGLSDWAAAVGTRLRSAQDLLTRLANVKENAPDAVQQLTTIESELRQLADEQRDAETPPVVGRVRDLLDDAFTSYAEAAHAAALGLENSDSAQIDLAVELIGTAESNVNRATALLQRAANECGLAPSTPVAEAGN